jgi:hypothetical protein
MGKQPTPDIPSLSRVRHRELERIWTCGNYIKPNADLDWGYGSSIADQASRYGYSW